MTTVTPASAVVVGYTANKSGLDAVAFGARLARATAAPLVIAIVLPAEGRSVITPPNAGYERYLRDQADSWLSDAAAALPEGATHVGEVRYADSFAEGLVAAAEERSASFIVVGSASGVPRGHHRLGSTATELVHFAGVPVVLVPRGARKADPAAGIARITAAVGTRPGADALLEVSVALATETGAALRLLSIATVDLPPTVDTGLIRLAGAAHADDVLSTARAGLPDEIAVEVVTAQGDSIEDAVADVEWAADDIVVVGSSRLAQPRRLFLGTTATKMLHAIPVPVIVTPRTLRDDPSSRDDTSRRANGGAS